MINAHRSSDHSHALWAGSRLVTFLVAMVLLLGALITPWGLAKSHGSAAIAVVEDSASWNMDAGLGHSHDDDAPSSMNTHVHHASDHTHDSAHALPAALLGSDVACMIWRQCPADAGPWPTLGGLERPPRT